jgi:hypothetical protein
MFFRKVLDSQCIVSRIRGQNGKKLSRSDISHSTFKLEPPVQGLTRCIKGTVSREFLLLVFLWISFPPAPEYPIRAVSNFFENSRRYSQVKVHHRYQRHRWQIIGTVLGCWDLKVNLKAKCLYMFILLPKGEQTR